MCLFFLKDSRCTAGPDIDWTAPSTKSEWCKLQWKEILPHSSTYFCKQAIKPAFLGYELKKRLRLVYKQELFHLLTKLSICLQIPHSLECGINQLENLFLVQCELYCFWKLVFSHYYVCLRFMQALLEMNDLGLFTLVFPSSSSVLRNIQVFLTRKQLRLTKITKE